jgi:metal-responsive CopG/Arc/MetJ family transcriptional regulator
MARQPKKRMGRPPTGRTPHIAITVPKQILEAVDKIAHNEKTSRSKIVQQLLAEALEARRKL